MQLSTRNASLEDLVNLLQQQHSRKLDAVCAAQSLRSEAGVIRIHDTEAQITDTGVVTTDGLYRPTVVGDEGLAEKLNIPTAYLRRMRDSHIDLFDANVNGWLSRDDRKFLVRCFRSGELDGEGVMRAFLSDTFKPIDNLDVLVAALEGAKEAGVEVKIAQCDLTERRMSVKVVAPEMAVLAPVLLRNYRSPFDDNDPVRIQRAQAHGWITPDDRPVVFAGFRISNSETGGGAFSITPEITVKVCTNGLLFTSDALRKVHLGGRLDEGLIRWSSDTLEKCQPPGTMVLVPDGQYRRTDGDSMSKLRQVPIETLKPGDKVVPYAGPGRLVLSGVAVTEVQARPFSGRLVVIRTENGKVSRYTPNHRCIAQVGPGLAGRHVVYLMKKGASFRIGVTSGLRTRDLSNGVAMRATTEHADAAWILSTHSSRPEALAAEAYTSWQYAIPDMTFQVTPPELARGSRTQEAIDGFWQKVGDLTEQASECLEAFGRKLAYPYLQAGNWHPARRVTEIHACNLLDGMKILDGLEMVNNGKRANHSTNRFSSISVSSEFYEGPVWSLDVEKHHTYVADGIVTHNSLSLVTAQTRDAISTFLDVEYVAKKVAELERSADTPVTDAAETVKVVASKLNISKERQTQVLDFFIKGGQLTAAGVMQAVSAVAQVVEDADEAFELEAAAVRSMELAASL